LALAWVHAQGDDVFPIPGTKTAARVEENAHAVALAACLTAEDIQKISEAALVAQGDRYPPEMLQQTYVGRL
jgi:aryl-alcohol dehydrogenase-like predicted oxidoreductase